MCDAAAGADGNRTSYTDVHNGGTPTSVAYCYDNADRLTGTTVAGAPSGANPLFAANLTSSNLTYDAQGNTTTLADESLTYDADGENIGTTQSDGSTVAYVRDASGSVVQRTLTPSAGTPTVYRYSGPFILTGSNALVETDLSLPGGVSVEIPVSGAQSWSYPDLHGDNIIQCDGAGGRGQMVTDSSGISRWADLRAGKAVQVDNEYRSGDPQRVDHRDHRRWADGPQREVGRDRRGPHQACY